MEIVVVLGIIVVLAAMLLPVFSSVRANGHKVACLSQVKQLLEASSLYASDNNRRLVPARAPGGGKLGTTWCVALQPYLKSKQILICPLDEAPQTVANSADLPHSYGINYDLTFQTGYGISNLSYAMSAIPRTADLLLFFDMKSTAAAMGSSYTANRVSRVETRHGKYTVTGWLDGHAKPMKPADLNSSRVWNPTIP
jgi:type II secretory pathway pseudopilin PulG